MSRLNVRMTLRPRLRHYVEALLATLVTNTAVCAHHFAAGNVRLRVAAVLGVSAMAASYGTAKTISLSVPEEGIRGFIFTALVASGISMLR